VKRPEILPIVVSLLVLVAASVCTVLEDLAYPRFLNAVEHICYAASGLLMVWGCVRLKRLPARAEVDAE
jgi:hypothetical protein